MKASQHKITALQMFNKVASSYILSVVGHNYPSIIHQYNVTVTSLDSAKDSSRERCQMQATPPQPPQPRQSDEVQEPQANANSATAKTVSFGQRSLWCCSFCVMPVFIPMLIYMVKDSDMLRRIFLGLFTSLIFFKLICFSIAMFHTRTHRAIIARRNSDDDRFSRRSFAPPTRLLHGPNQSQNSSSSRSNSSNAPTRFNSPRQPDSRSFSIHAPIDSSRGNQFVVDDPPPYHLALSLPHPHEHTITITERAETPPPSYEKILA